MAAATGTITTIAGKGAAGFSGDGGPATAAMLSLPMALAVDGPGDVFFSNTGNHRVREILAATGKMVTVATSGVPGGSVTLLDGGAQLQSAKLSPGGVALFTVSFGAPGMHPLSAA
ncbi:MAG TPA: hypothetical protein VNW54_12095 [Granulicella sp.]|nr:hypothetical protein [Granulicella sp.]